MDRVVTVPVKEYLRLTYDSITLAALEGAGVDNWEGTSEIDWEEIVAQKEEASKRIANIEWIDK